MNYIAAYLVVALLVVLCNAFIAIAINNDAAARLKKEKPMRSLPFSFRLLSALFMAAHVKKWKKSIPRSAMNAAITWAKMCVSVRIARQSVSANIITIKAIS